MVSKSTNINNYMSHQIIEHRKVPYDIRNQSPDLGHAHICGNHKCTMLSGGLDHT